MDESYSGRVGTKILQVALIRPGLFQATLRLFPVVALCLFLAPVGAGLIATVLPAFGYFPALGGESLSLEPWRTLFTLPGIAESLRLTLFTGFLATLLAFVIVIGFCSVVHGTRLFNRAQIMLSPLLATPHVAVAIGLSFLISPSGWMARWVSPWLTGWNRPPDVSIIHDPLGLSFVLGLLLKEVPYLTLMTVAALGQVRSRETLVVARSLGYSPVKAWLRTVLPQIYPQIRLPIYAVLAFSMSVVDVAIVLAPTNPPPLSALVFRLFLDRDLKMIFPAAAGACLQFMVVVAAICLWRLMELTVQRVARPWLTKGPANERNLFAGPFWIGIVGGLVSLSLLGTLALVLWSFARSWFYPQSLPQAWTLSHWARQLQGLVWPSTVTLVVGFSAAIIALILTIGCLQNERVNGLGSTSRTLWLLYTPLLVPQIAFLFGVQILLVRFDLDNTWTALVWSHLLFVFPYVFLSLADPWRSFDVRYRDSALTLTGSSLKTFFLVELPLMLMPTLFALALGFAVSVGQYLPTIFAGGGRFTTLTVEAVTLSSGGDRRVVGIYAFIQAALPLIVYCSAIMIPRWAYRKRRGMHL